MMSRKGGFAQAPFLFVTSIASASAQTITTATTTVPASPFASMMQGIVGLVLVVGLIYGVSWAIRRFAPRARSSGAVQVVGGASVGPREKVVVVRFGHQTLLLGVAPGQVSLLHSTDAADVDPAASIDSSQPRFVDRLRAARGGA